MTFEEVYASLPSRGWLTRSEAALVWPYLQRKDVSTILEVGCYCGRSSTLLASCGHTLYCVDPFAGFDSGDPSGEKTMAEWYKNMLPLNLGLKLTLCLTRVEHWFTRPVELAYLDGDHTYKGTLTQIEAALACGAKVVFVHDVNDSGEGRAVRDACLELLGPWKERTERLAVWELP